MPATTQPALTRWGWRFLGVALGGALSLVFPEANAWWWAHLGLVPVLLVVRAAPTRREAGIRAWSSATGFFVGLHHWLLPSLGPFTIPVALATGLTWIPFGVVAWYGLRPPLTATRAAGAMVLGPSVWVLGEYVRSWDRLGGSWGHLGYSQWQVEPVLAVAALGGVWALSFVLVAVNVGATLVVARGATTRARLVGGGVAVALLVIAVGYGLARPEPPVEGTVRVGGVQVGKIDPRDERLAANLELNATLAGRAVDLVVWGQSSVGFDPATDDDVRRRLTDAAEAVGTDVLVNVDARRTDGRIAKSAVLFSSEGPVDRYDKTRLVPFGEYIPLRSVFGWVARFTDAADEDRVPGDGPTLMSAGELTFGPVISYESTFPDFRRALARQGAELTIVQGASTTFQGSWAQPQQASFEAVRAVGSGRPSVLVTLSGTSAAFDARGRELAWVPATETTAFVVDVPLSQEDTFFVRHGDWVPLASALVAAAALARVAVHRARARQPAPEAPAQATR